MRVFLLNEKDEKRLTQSIDRFQFDEDKLLLFREPEEEVSDDNLSKLMQKFRKVEVFECPNQEYSIRLGILKDNTEKVDVLYFVGPSMSEFYLQHKDDFLDFVSGVCVAKTFNVEKKSIITNKRKKRKAQKDESQLTLDFSQQKDINLSALMNSLNNKTPEDLPEMDQQEEPKENSPEVFRPKTSFSASNSRKPPKKSSTTERQNRRPSSPHMKQANEQNKKVNESKMVRNIEDAKGRMCAAYLERYYQHLIQLCFSGKESASPIHPEEITKFIIMLLRSYSRALEHQKQLLGEETPASEIDYDCVYEETIGLFESSWAALNSIVKLKKEAVKVLLPEAQYYWRFTKMLYEEDLWETI